MLLPWHKFQIILHLIHNLLLLVNLLKQHQCPEKEPSCKAKILLHQKDVCLQVGGCGFNCGSMRQLGYNIFGDKILQQKQLLQFPNQLMWDQKTNKPLAIFLAWAVKKCGNEARDTRWLVRVLYLTILRNLLVGFSLTAEKILQLTNFQHNPQQFVRLQFLNKAHIKPILLLSIACQCHGDAW